MRDKDKDDLWRFKRISFKYNGVKLLAYYGYISEDCYQLQLHSPYKISNTIYRILPSKDTHINMRNIVKENIIEYYTYAETVKANLSQFDELNDKFWHLNDGIFAVMAKTDFRHVEMNFREFNEKMFKVLHKYYEILFDRMFEKGTPEYELHKKVDFYLLDRIIYTVKNPKL